MTRRCIFGNPVCVCMFLRVLCINSRRINHKPLIVVPSRKKSGIWDGVKNATLIIYLLDLALCLNFISMYYFYNENVNIKWKINLCAH